MFTDSVDFHKTLVIDWHNAVAYMCIYEYMCCSWFTISHAFANWIEIAFHYTMWPYNIQFILFILAKAGDEDAIETIFAYEGLPYLISLL